MSKQFNPVGPHEWHPLDRAAVGVSLWKQIREEPAEDVVVARYPAGDAGVIVDQARRDEPLKVAVVAEIRNGPVAGAFHGEVRGHKAVQQAVIGIEPPTSQIVRGGTFVWSEKLDQVVPAVRRLEHVEKVQDLVHEAVKPLETFLER